MESWGNHVRVSLRVGSRRLVNLHSQVTDYPRSRSFPPFVSNSVSRIRRILAAQSCRAHAAIPCPALSMLSSPVTKSYPVVLCARSSEILAARHQAEDLELEAVAPLPLAAEGFA